MASWVLIINELLIANRIGSIKCNNELIEKCRKLFKTRKLSKSHKSAKLEKKLSKSRNSPNFNAKKNGPSFLIPNAWTAFNRLRLAFIKTPILQYFDLEYHI